MEVDHKEVDYAKLLLPIGPARPDGLVAEKSQAGVDLRWLPGPQGEPSSRPVFWLVWKDGQALATTDQPHYHDGSNPAGADRHSYQVEAIVQGNSLHWRVNSHLSDKAWVNSGESPSGSPVR